MRDQAATDHNQLTKVSSDKKRDLPNRWGHFAQEGHSFVIERPDTPGPWENYLYSLDGKFQIEISQRGKGIVRFRCAQTNTVAHGRNYCLLDLDGGACWSLNAGEAPTEPHSYRCEHRPGHSLFEVEHEGIGSCLTVTAALEEYIEVNSLRLKNTTDKPRRLSLIGYYDVELAGISNDNQVEKSRFAEDIGSVLVQRCIATTAKYKYAAFYVADRQPNSYCGDLAKLFDSDVSREKASIWTRGRLPNVNARATRLVQALQHDIILAPREELTINYGFGLADDMVEAEQLARLFLSQGKAARIIAENKQFFQELLLNSPVQTEEEPLNILLNIWTKVQLHRQVVSARGGNTHNWRNNLLDGWGWLPFDPSWTKYYLERVCSLARADGSLPRASLRIPELPRGDYIGFFLNARYNDIPTWAAVAAGRYGAETGDLDFFQQEVKYADGTKEGTIAECLINAMRWITRQTGRHGMVLFLDGDWCDPLNEAGKKGRGESPWTSVAFVSAVRHFNPLLIKLGYSEVARELQQAADQFTRAVNEHAWDGQWYIRGITDDGVRFCTKDDTDGNVSLWMQAWALYSGIVPEERLSVVLQSIEDYLETDYGPTLYGPPFRQERPEIGRITAKQPGTGENGSVYVHGAIMLAEGQIAAGRPDAALRNIKHVLPLRDPDCTETTRAVPLWFPNFWHGPDSEQPGLTSGIIGTGSLATLYNTVFEGFLGIRPTLEGLRVRPCFPSKWSHVTFQRRWRGSIYNFEFQRDPEARAPRVELNGRVLPSPLIPIPQKQETHEVKVYLEGQV